MAVLVRYKQAMSNTIWAGLAADTERMAAEAFSEIHTLEDWEKYRPRRREEFLRTVGLATLPERCDLRLTDYGELRGDGFRARKIAFQILPDCWASACIFYPDPLPPEAAPGVLYLCGHAANGLHHYQALPIMWARRGYVCLIVETIEQSDNPGEHHGFNLAWHPTWISLGYTSAGGELWNSIRALDVLAVDPHVDAGRLAATGVSGGGSLSFFLAIADERVKAVSTLCGISSPVDAIANRHLFGHCDCFYPHNVFGRDISEYAALIAPRAALFCFADHDPLFHPVETKALVDRMRRIYELYGQKDHCELVTCPGPHGNHPEFDQATSAWFDRHVAGSAHPEIPVADEEFTEPELSVFNGVSPVPNHLHLLPDLLTPRGGLALPQQPDEWPRLRQEIVARLKKEIFCAREMPGTLKMERDGDWLWSARGPAEKSVRIHRGTINNTDVWLQMVRPGPAPRRLVITVADGGETSQQAMARSAVAVNTATTTYAGYEPRLAGDRAPMADPGLHFPGSRLPSIRTNLLRAMALTGITPVMMICQDILGVIDYLLTLEELRDVEIYVAGRGEAGIAALYSGVLDERIAGVILEDPPGSHRTGAPVLGILRVLDLPQAVALMAPRPVALVNPVYSNWTWPERLYQRLGCPEKFIITEDIRSAMEKMAG